MSFFNQHIDEQKENDDKKMMKKKNDNFVVKDQNSKIYAYNF
jgi:hypothetical protein